MKKVLLIIVILVGLIVSGAVWWRIRSGRPDRLLSRAQTALNASQLDDAIMLADNYIARFPDNWRGYFIRAQALMRRGKYADARKTLETAAGLVKNAKDSGSTMDATRIKMVIANSYSFPAAYVMSKRQDDVTVAQLKEAVENLKQSLAVLNAIHESDTGMRLDVLQSQGRNARLLGECYDRIASTLRIQARLRQSSGFAKQSQALAREAVSYDSLAAKAYTLAMGKFYEVVSAEPSRKMAGQNLAELCVLNGNIEPYERSRKLLLEEAKVVPEAKVIIWMQDIQMNQTVLTPPQLKSKIADVTGHVDELLKKSPNNRSLLIARARLALLEKDGETAEKCCKKVLNAQPKHDQARLLLALAMLEKGEKKEAENILYELKTDFPNWPDAQYSYARAVNLMGKNELAKQALRHTVQIDPGHAESRRMLVEMMMTEGFYDNAYLDARAYYDAHPNDPKALELLVSTCSRTNRQGEAIDALNAALKKYPDSPAMMLVVANGYSVLGDTNTARNIITPTANTAAGTWQERLAIIRAKIMAGQITQAEKMLLETVKVAPDSAVVYHELANLYASTNRTMLAIENYRKSLSLDENNTTCRLSLATILFRTGLLREALTEAQKVLDVEPANSQAAILADQIRVILDIPGESVVSSSGQKIQSASLLKLAMTFLEHGNPEKAVELCDQVLRNSPDNPNAFLTIAQARLEQGNLQNAINNCERAISCDPELLPTYLRMAVILSRKMSIDKVYEIFSKAASAKIYMEQMAMAWLCEQRGEWTRAERFYNRVSNDEDTPKSIADMAILRKAFMQGRQGRPDEAFETLAVLEKKPQWDAQALMVKAQVALMNGKDFQDSMRKLLEIAKQKNDASIFERLVFMSLQAGKPDFAMSVCDSYRRSSPQSARPYVMMGLVAVTAGDFPKAVEFYEQAVTLQPSNVQIRIMLAGAYNQAVMPEKALKTLDEMIPLGPSAKAQALYEKSKMLAGWGLQQPAIAFLGELGDMGFGNDPRVQFAIGVAYASLGKTVQARDSLLKVPSYVPQYIPARQLLANLETSGDEKLRILNELLTANPGITAVRLQKIRTLILIGRKDAAIAETNYLLKEFASYGAQPQSVSNDFLDVLLKLELYPQALSFSEKQAAYSGRQEWKKRALALQAMIAPKKVFEALTPAKADLYDSLIAIAACGETGTDASPWREAFTKYVNSSSPNVRATVSRYGTLVNVTCGLPVDDKQANVMPQPVIDSLVADKNKIRDAAGLILINVSSDLAMPDLAMQLSWKLFLANPSCQWAVMDILSLDPPTSKLEEVAAKVDKSSFAGRLVQAEIAFRSDKLPAACDALGELSKKYPDNATLMLRYGIALERADRLKEALEIYRAIWKKTGDVIAANNAASITAQLFPKDPDQLTAASALMTEVLKKAPNVSAFMDTKGWIEYLRGSDIVARRYLLAGIIGLADSAEAHYHVGMVEKNRDPKMALWHFQAAVDYAKKQKLVTALSKVQETAMLESQKQIKQLEQTDAK